MSIGMQRFPRGMNPNEYLQRYAAASGMSAADAKNSLQGQYGNPQADGLRSTSIFSADDRDLAPTLSNDFKGDFDFDSDMMMAQSGQASGMVPNIFQNIMNFFMGGNGPQKEGDPQMSELKFNLGSGPKSVGDPQFEGQSQGMQEEGQQGMDPDAYAQQYAEENGISLEEAKAQLRAKYGDPQRQ
ncbi:hypothetical protein IJG14_00365 [bacterium]|nr:hypothetical protein [bacterium]